MPRTMANPFVYGEVVPAGAFVDRETELDRLTARPARRAEDLPDFAAALRQVVARAPGARGRGPRRRADRRGHGQQLQLVRRVPRGLCPCAARRSRRGSTGRARGCATCSAASGPRSASNPTSAAAASSRSRFPSSGPSKDVVAAGAGGVRAARAGSPKRASAGSRSRSTSSRRSDRSTAAASSMRCAPPCSTSARSATCSPDPSRA